MSGLLLIHHRDERPVERPLAQRLFERLDHRGPDGCDLRFTASAVFGHQHFWTTPEELGERQPLTGDGVQIALDGRLDNREELIGALDGATADLSDAALLLRAYFRWGEKFFAHLLGPLAVVVLDLARRRVLCGRDALGDRTLFYYLDAKMLAVASEANALLAHPAVSSQLDEGTLARFLALRAPAPGATFFADVRELPPATAMSVDPEGVRTWRHWQPRLEAPRRRSDADQIDEFRSILRESVRCRLRAPAAPAVLMSGGLDSTSVAALAARELNGHGRQRVLAVSWVFDELKSIDERPYMDAVVEAAGLATLRFAGDDAWPLSNPDTWPHHPDAPLEGLFRRLRQRAYVAAAGAGRRVLLTGEYGDNLYSGHVDWLSDLVREGRWLTAGRGLLASLRRVNRQAPGATFGDAVVRALGGRRYGASSAGWLTPEAHALVHLEGGDGSAPSGLTAGCRERWDALLDSRGSQAVALETANAARAGIELRRPYRDRRLVELCLELPAHLLFRPGWLKWILRQAMAGILPEAVRRRRHGSSLFPLCRRGLVEREAATVNALLQSPAAVWPRYVRSDWMAAAYPRALAEQRQGAAAVIAWRCICMELWSQRRRGEESVAPAAPGAEFLMVGSR